MPFFNSLLYNLELLLEMTSALLIIVGCNRKSHMYDKVLGQFVSLQLGFDRRELSWVAGWFNRLLFSSVIIFFVGITVDWLSWQQPYMTLSSLCCVHIPVLLTAMAVSQYWFAITFVLQNCRKINRQMNEFSDRTNDDGDKRLYELERLRMQHKDLHELMLYINDGFGKLLLSTFLAIVVVVNVELLELYQYFRRGVLSVSVGSHILYALVWLLLHLVLLLLIVYPNHAMHNERMRTGLLLFELPGMDSERGDHGIMHFSQQILHQRQPYKACGIITLNLSIISTIVGALSTCLVILIQFASN
ncbi:uncharacterized protein LOC128266998 [Anopheles cruzii]|uniref:uncharacterized protein LOC128266998 n=1 Tax=Anopheles cruzii TaxID=68878 RepID=UPI0022EC7838|nr:uncharacterized protein LOC128266998 [Anopheles cruzii]